MKISGDINQEINKKIAEQNISKEINNSLPNSKNDLLTSKTLNLETDDILHRISQFEYKYNGNNDENSIDIKNDSNNNNNKNSIPQVYWSLKTKSNPNNIIKIIESSEDSTSKESKENTNFIESKNAISFKEKNLLSENKSNNNNNKSADDDNTNTNNFNSINNHNNSEYFKTLSISDIQIDAKRELRFSELMERKKKELFSIDYVTNNLYKYDSKQSQINYNEAKKKIKIRLFLEENKLTAFNSSTNFSLKSYKYFPLVNLDFDFLTAELLMDTEDLNLRIVVLASNRAFTFNIPDENHFFSIANKINTIIKNSKGFTANLLGITLRKDFYKFYFISNNNFISKAKTGDILLFRGFEYSAKCQRCLTGAHYDHVALLIKSGKELQVYEATSLQGCKVRSWRAFIVNKWIYSYDKIIYRELLFNASNEDKIKELKQNLEDNLQQYLIQTKDKKYVLSSSIICCPGKKEHEQKNEWNQSEGFFCSQLVAAAYMKMGIIKYEKSSLRYFPGSFSQKSSLVLSENFFLGPEMIVDFSEL